MRAFVEGYGCSLNKADTEQIRGFLAGHGFELAATPEKADLVVINTCAVKQPTEARMLGRIRQLHSLASCNGKRLVVAGCLPRISPDAVASISPSLTMAGPNLEELAEHLGLPKQSFSPGGNAIRENPYISILPIARGCRGSCSFCCVRSARGELRSYSVQELDKSFKNAIKEAPEVWLTGQDTGCYGQEIGESLPSLLKTLLRNDGNYRIRVGMLSPQHLLRFFDRYISLFNDKRLYRFFHIPVQSGSNAILRKMNRPYSRQQFLSLVEAIRERLPNATIATDVIAGFPGEGEKQFNETVSLLKEVKPDVVNISRFGKRPGTAAEKMPGQLPCRVLKERSRALARRCSRISLERNKRFMGKEAEILVTERGSKGNFVGRSSSYKPVVVKKNILGKFGKVKIKSAFPTYLLGELC